MKKEINRQRGNYILGLDLGTNSIGWAVVDCEIEREPVGATHYYPTALVDCNSRIFEEAVTKKERTPKNQQRREKRGMRKMYSHFRGRRDHLVHLLQREKLLPSDLDSRTMNSIDASFAERWRRDNPDKGAHALNFYTNPFAMRALALDYPLTEHEMGRIFVHLLKHRGYFSNHGAKFLELNEKLDISVELDGEDDEENATTGKSATDFDNGSAKKDDTDGQDSDAKTVKRGISALKHELARLQSRTIGEYIYKKSLQEHTPPQRIGRYYLTAQLTTKKKIASKNANSPKSKDFALYATRQMYKNEFVSIWNAQVERGFLSRLAPTTRQKLRENIWRIIFFQRPLKSQKFLVGACSFLPHRKRAPRASLLFQETRLWQYINNIKIKVGGAEPNNTQQELSFGTPHTQRRTTKRTVQEKLNDSQRKLIFEAAHNSQHTTKEGRLSWATIATLLNIDKESLNYSDLVVEGTPVEAKTGIVANRTAIALHQILVDTWQHYSTGEKEQLVTDILTTRRRGVLYDRLVKHWKYSPGATGTAYKIASLELEANYGKHCTKVLQALLPYLQEGDLYWRAVEKAGYLREDQKEISYQKEIYPHDIPNIANPVVQRAISETRKVINAIIKRYGRPALIRVELAREMKASKQHRKDIRIQQAKNAKVNQDAERELAKEYSARHTGNHNVSRKHREKYKLWKEQKFKCIYCDNTISINDVLSDECDIDHIVPHSLFPQSKDNIVLACRACNGYKSQQTPYQAWGGSERWKQIEHRLFTGEALKKHYGFYPIRKAQRILAHTHKESDTDGFVERSLNDTRYISVAAKNVIKKLGVPVQVSKGGGTSDARREWDLNTILPQHPQDDIVQTYQIDTKGEITGTKKWTRKEWNDFKDTHPPTDERPQYIKVNEQSTQESEGRKNRRDHRHHAIDAVVVALADQKLYHRLLDIWRKPTWVRDSPDALLPFDKLYTHWHGGVMQLKKQIEDALEQSAVSHQSITKIHGALHEESYYGPGRYHERWALSTDTRALKKIQKELLPPDHCPDQRGEINKEGKVSWIASLELYTLIKGWCEEALQRPLKERTLPSDQRGKIIRDIVVAHRCYVIREAVENAIKNVGAKLTGLKDIHKRANGKGRWIIDDGVYRALALWKSVHTSSDSDLKEVLKSDPPRMCRKGDTHIGSGNLIKKVRVGMRLGVDSVHRLHHKQVVQFGGNHHLELFAEVSENTANSNKSPKQRGNYVTMFEAAQRIRRGESIIHKEPPAHWEGEWRFVMTLAINDPVILTDVENSDNTKLWPPIYRVQTLSGPVDMITLRYHTVATTGDDYGREIRRSNTLRCTKIAVDTLGNYRKIQGDDKASN